MARALEPANVPVNPVKSMMEQADETLTVAVPAPEEPSKFAVSPAIGNEAPLPPPVAVLQFVVEFQLPVPPATQNRVTATS